MKTFLKILLSLLLLTQICFGQWEVVHKSLAGHLRVIDFVNENVGWLAGDEGTLFKTLDAGETWIHIPLSESWYLYQIDFVNDSVGWAVGHNVDTRERCIIAIRFTEGVYTWSIQKQITDIWSVPSLSLYAVDDSTVFASDDGNIFKTTNAGLDWVDVSPNVSADRWFQSIWFQDASTGVVVGKYNDENVERGILLKTSNGGSNWNETIVNEFNSIYDLQFLDNSNGYFRAHLDTASYLCKTEDMFSSWSVILQVPLKSYQFIDSSKAYAIIDGIESNHILKSDDGGISWNEIYTPIEGISFENIYFSNLSTGFVLSSQGGGIFGLFRSTDYGLNWKLKDFSIPLIDISFVDENKAFMFGGYRWGHGDSYGGEYSIMVTSNGGSEWNIKHAIHGYISFYYLMNDSVGFLSYSRPYSLGQWLLKTTDFGDSWIDVTPDLEFICGDISFQNDMTGWMVGDKIYKTTDSGNNWYVDYADSQEGFYLYSISCASTIAWAVGFQGAMVKHSSQTGWVKQPSVTDLPLTKVVFLDDNNGWITGGTEWVDGFTKILLRTRNGGINWDIIPDIPYLFRDMQFIDNNIGWAIGYTFDYRHQGEGGILKTIDGGLTWDLQTSINGSSHLRGLFFKDVNNGWAVGENGIMLHTTNGGVTYIKEAQTTEMPTKYVLLQNYPNPFNPSTTIRYQIPDQVRNDKLFVTLSGDEESFVTLKVYDVLGREAATLVNKKQKPGNYQVEWNASNLPSGVYFYQLKAGEFAQTMKMLLLK